MKGSILEKITKREQSISSNSCRSNSLNLYSEVMWDDEVLEEERTMIFQYIFRHRKVFNCNKGQTSVNFEHLLMCNNQV